MKFCGEHGLSMREREVLYFVLAGRTNAETAHELDVTEGTVKFHMTSILRKTACASRNDIAKLYNKPSKAATSVFADVIVLLALLTLIYFLYQNILLVLAR